MGAVVVLVLAVALPLAIVVFTVVATASEVRSPGRAPVGRRCSALVFAVAALLGGLWLSRGTGFEYEPVVAVWVGVPAIALAALLAVLLNPLLAGRSRCVAAVCGACIAALSAAGTSFLVLAPFAPDDAMVSLAGIGMLIVLSPTGLPVLLLGAAAGALLSHLSNRSPAGGINSRTSCWRQRTGEPAR